MTLLIEESQRLYGHAGLSGTLRGAGEYGLMGLLALGMCYVLLLANGNADFGAPAPKPPQAPWPQPRQSVPGWLSLHLSFLERLSDAGSSQVHLHSGVL